MINELKVFTQMELDKGGVAYELENNGVVRLYKFQEWYWYKHNRYGNTPVYQVFRAKDGKRLFATTDYPAAISAYESLTKLITEVKDHERDFV